MSLYEQLGIEPTASQQHIKKAYFRLVRQFTPEKAPDDFIRIRKAYEVLSNEADRTAYDTRLSQYTDMPEEISAIILAAEEMGMKGLRNDAVKLLEESEYASHNDVQCALCQQYLDWDKSGKAVKIIEKLIAKNEGNANYLRMAVKAYIARGWDKKAHEARKRLEQIDSGNEENSAALLFNETQTHPSLLGITIEMIEKKGGKAPLLCAHSLRNMLLQTYSTIDDFRRQLMLESMGKSVVSLWDDPLFAAQKLTEHTVDFSSHKRERVYSLLEDILQGMYQEDCYSILPFIDQIIENTRSEKLYESQEYITTSAGYIAWEAVQSGIPKILVSLPLMHVWSQSEIISDDYKMDFLNEVVMLEFDVLVRHQFLTPYIQRFQSHPFYQQAADFFNMVLQSSEGEIQNETRKRLNQAMKTGSRFTLEWLGEDDEFDDINVTSNRQTPVRVTKIGRNDPCPCGSGKKYKKCCQKY